VQTKPSPAFFEELGFRRAWLAGHLSNFEYLLLVNRYSGRSFNNSSLYPVMPWIIADYDSAEMRLGDPSFFRDLTIPIGCHDGRRMAEIEKRRIVGIESEFYYYASYANSPITVFLWLLRMEPFTTLHIQMQNGRFDHPARLFSSLADAWRIVTTQLNDYRELVPEFFFQPEFLVNSNGFDLGQANGVCIDNVALPGWAKTPIDFVYLHRKALESDFVSANLGAWIDLIWGVKQRGQAAKDAKNTYDPHLYPEAWTAETRANPESTRILLAAMEQLGQIPTQLFSEPHPSRTVTREQGNVRYAIGCPTGEGLVFVSIWAGSKCKCDVICCDTRGVLTTFHASFRDGTFTPSTRLSPTIDPSSTVDIARINAVEIAVATTTCLVIIVNIETDVVAKLGGHTGRVNSLSADARHIVSGGSDAIAHCWTADNFAARPHRVPIFRDEIICSCLSSEFGFWAQGTLDGAIVVVDAHSGAIARVIALDDGGRPNRVIVTREWGFILAYVTRFAEGALSHALELFSVNGDPIRTKQLPAAVVAWTTFASERGFDYVVLADANGSVFLFEAFFLNLGKRIDFVLPETPVVGVFCVQNDDCIVVVTSQGSFRVQSIPRPLPGDDATLSHV
jgi:hypothetical protein